MTNKSVGSIIFLCAIAVAAAPGELAGDPVTADSIVTKLVEADRMRAASLAGYTGSRSYYVENTRFNVRANMKVDVTVDAGGVKTFRVVEAKGPGAIRKMVFQRMLDTESTASAKAARDATQISPANYSFRFIETVADNGRKTYLLEVEPKTQNQLLFRGRVWVDAAEYAVVRIEGSPSKNPSFWVKKTRFTHTYHKVGDFWLGASNHSESDIRLFGRSITRIDYSDYRIAAASAALD
jgi:hypothetical protein